MHERVEISVNGRPLTVRPGTTVAAAVLLAGFAEFRRSVTGQPRGPVCGMGICYECRVRVDGVPHVKSCQVPCKAGMEIATDE